jgi:hypothetical protein
MVLSFPRPLNHIPSLNERQGHSTKFLLVTSQNFSLDPLTLARSCGLRSVGEEGKALIFLLLISLLDNQRAILVNVHNNVHNNVM